MPRARILFAVCMYRDTLLARVALQRLARAQDRTVSEVVRRAVRRELAAAGTRRQNDEDGTDA